MAEPPELNKYRRRNIALAGIAAAAVVAAVTRVSFGPPPQVPATAVAPAESAMPAAREAANGAVSSAVRAVEIPVHLALGPGIELPAATTVFLIVRTPGGGAMPLAVKRMTVADLPADVTLSDADAMTADSSLRDAGDVELVARTSASGDVRAGPGDYEGKSGSLRVAEISHPITLVIDHAL